MNGMCHGQVLAQLQAQQGGGSLPQHIKLQLPIQIQQSGTTSAQGGQVSNPACFTRILGPFQTWSKVTDFISLLQ